MRHEFRDRSGLNPYHVVPENVAEAVACESPLSLCNDFPLACRARHMGMVVKFYIIILATGAATHFSSQMTMQNVKQS
jgi:hypothetical protein